MLHLHLSRVPQYVRCPKDSNKFHQVTRLLMKLLPHLLAVIHLISDLCVIRIPNKIMNIKLMYFLGSGSDVSDKFGSGSFLDMDPITDPT
jgi:hypothetical protein